MKARYPGGAGPSMYSGTIGRSHGGTVFLKNGRVREYVIPTYTNTDSQAVIRSAFNYLNERWGTTLTEEQRLAWVAAYKLQDWQVQDDFTGVQRPIKSPKQLFIKLNFNRFEALNLLATPEGGMDTPPSKTEAPILGNFQITVADSSNTVNLFYNGSLSNSFVFVPRLTPALTAATMSMKTAQCHLRTQLSADYVSTANIDHVANYTGQEGKKVFYVLQLVSSTTGQKIIVAAGNTVITA
jgi:hypothetical protein